MVDARRVAMWGGRALREWERRAIQAYAAGDWGRTRTELARRICEAMQWRRPNGKLKVVECRQLLELLERQGALELPARRRGGRRGPTGIVRTAAAEPQPAIAGELRALGAIRVELVHGRQERALWRELIDRYHYLGYVQAFGAQLRYFVRDAHGRLLGCVGFSSAAWRLAGREQWIDWSEAQRRQRLNRIVQQSRFLILPWVQVANLASHVLALSVRQLPLDWQRRYGVVPLLVETLVDEKRFAGTCYRAANWVDVGRSAGRGRMDREHHRHGTAPKRIFLYPLAADAAVQLRGGAAAAGRRPPRGAGVPARPRRPVTLSDDERRELERRVKAPTATQREAVRAQIVLGCANGETAQAVARRLAVSPRCVEKWRARFGRARLAGLQEQPRAGRKLKYETNIRIEVLALACEPLAMAGGTPIRRTIEQVRRRAIERGLVAQIGWSTVQRILSEGDVRPHHVRGWLHSPDPHFRQLVNEITALYLTPPPDAVVIAVDEKPGMQATERRHPSRAAAPGRSARFEFEYRRHGTQTLIAGFVVHTGEVLAACGDTRTAGDLLAFMEQVAARFPDRPIHVIWDNLNIHSDGKDARWTTFNQRHRQRFSFHYTPKHASWVNQVELFFSLLQRRCLRGASFRSASELRAAVLAFIGQWNRTAHPFRWTFRGYPLQSGVDERRLVA
jgi:transposase